jgi:hypothetical protein
MALGTHILPSWNLKCDFGVVDEAMFQGVKRPCEHIFCFLDVAKCNFVEVYKAVASGRKTQETYFPPSNRHKIRLG